MTTWGDNLRDKMAKASDTCRSLGVELGVSPTSVSYWCVGRSVPGCEHAQALAERYGVAVQPERRNGRPPKNGLTHCRRQA
jgi:DNA-binding transcriptional regulator YdaS (Cro superfamily)